MLTIDRTKRATIEELRHHPWVNLGYSNPPPSCLPDRPALSVDELNEEIIAKLETVGFVRADIIR